jgi:hypothetical protein
MDVLSKSDFPEIISDKFSEARVLTPDQVEATIIDTFEKGQSTEEVFLKGMNVLDRLEKGKRANVGETRTWGGKKYQKGTNSWTPVKEGGSAPAKTESTKEKTSETVKPGSFAIYSRTGGGYGAQGEVNGKTVNVVIPKEYFKGLSGMGDKGFREKVKDLVIEESKKEETAGQESIRKTLSSDWENLSREDKLDLLDTAKGDPQSSFKSFSEIPTSTQNRMLSYYKKYWMDKE